MYLHKTKMNWLPAEILELIFSKLSKLDILNLLLTCKRFNKMISASNCVMEQLTLFQKVDIMLHKATIVESLNENLYPEYPYLMRLVYRRSSAILLKFLLNMPKLEYFPLSAKEKNFEVIIKFLQRQTKLQTWCSPKLQRTQFSEVRN